MSKTIVHLVYSFGCGGLEKVIANLITHSSQFDVKHVVISLTNDITMMEQIPVPVEHFVLDKREGNDLASHKKLFSLLKQLKPHAINTYNFGTIEYHITARLAGVPVRVHSDHGRGGDDPQGKNRLHNLFRKVVAHFITEYIVVSYDLYEWVCNKLKINKNKVSLIFNGVSIPERQVVKQEQAKHYVTVGRLDKVKNQKLLIEAFDQALKTNDDFAGSVLSIVGDGPLLEELQALISKLEVSDSVKLLGYRDDIPEILASSDVFVLSSVYEAMPMTILEAMANSTPVVCTDVGGISRFISEREAWFVESQNQEQLAHKLVQLKEITQEKNNKIETAYTLVKDNYSVDKMVQNYLDKYQLNSK